MSVTEHAKEGLAQAGMGWGAAQVVGLNCEEWMDWYRDGEDTQQAPVTTEIQTAMDPFRNRDSISSKKMRLRRNVQECGTSCSITTITHPWILSNSP